MKYIHDKRCLREAQNERSRRRHRAGSHGMGITGGRRGGAGGGQSRGRPEQRECKPTAAVTTPAGPPFSRAHRSYVTWGTGGPATGASAPSLRQCSAQRLAEATELTFGTEGGADTSGASAGESRKERHLRVGEVSKFSGLSMDRCLELRTQDR